MDTLTRLDWVLQLARQLGYDVRVEWLGGARGGCCEVAGRRMLFVDESASGMEQLDQVIDALHQDGRLGSLRLNREQRMWLGLDRAA